MEHLRFLGKDLEDRIVSKNKGNEKRELLNQLVDDTRTMPQIPNIHKFK